MAKPHGERIERLEEAYVGIRDDIREIKDHLATQNGRIAAQDKFKIQAQAILGFLGFVVAVTAGTLITILAT